MHAHGSHFYQYYVSQEQKNTSQSGSFLLCRMSMLTHVNEWMMIDQQLKRLTFLANVCNRCLLPPTHRSPPWKPESRNILDVGTHTAYSALQFTGFFS